ncbi:MAG: ParB/RepB/Spo0J family partition protein [Solirubrobacterales bacterium]
MAERGMGRGLAAILPMSAGAAEDSLQRIPLNLIRPNPQQPRAHFSEVELNELAESIKARGVLQPVLVRPLAGGQYELIAGERRWRAARTAGLDRIPALVRSAEERDRLELALIENMAREDLNPIEAARACAALVDELGISKEEVGRRVGRSRASISNLTRLLELPDEVLLLLESGEISEGHGRAILQASGRQAQRTLAREVRDRGLSVREAEAMARTTATAPGKPRGGRFSRSDPDADQACRELEDALGAAFGSDVRVRLRRSSSGTPGARVEMSFDTLEEVRDLARRISGALSV